MAADIVIEGLEETMRVLRRLPKVAQRAIDAATDRFSRRQAVKVKLAGRRASRQAAAVVPAIKSGRIGGSPAIQMLASTPVRRGATAGDMFYGAEFGGGRRPSTRQFPTYRSTGYWFWPTLRQDAGQRDADTALMKIERAFNGRA